jgi:hypothetical protein
MKRVKFVSPRVARKNYEDKHLPMRSKEDVKFQRILRPLIKKHVTVYKGGNRYFLTKKEAATYEAKRILKNLCDCDYSPPSYYGPGGEYEPCRYHAMSADKWIRLRNRIANIILKEWGRHESLQAK